MSCLSLAPLRTITLATGKLVTMNKILAMALLGCLSLPAHAGFWDDLFGGGNSEEATPEPAAKSAPPAQPAPSMVETGLQLLPLLTQSLGVSSGQAAGGMGSLLQTAQALLSNSEFATIAKAIPGAETLMKAAPVVKELSGGSGMMSNAMNMASKYSPEAKAGTELVSQFKSLGMGADMIPGFTRVGSDYLRQNGNPEAGALLQNVISGLL